ncbi:hypothetical protein Q0S35_06015, partial [Escherichia coli B15/O112:H1]
ISENTISAEKVKSVQIIFCPVSQGSLREHDKSGSAPVQEKSNMVQFNHMSVWDAPMKLNLSTVN